MTSTSLRFLFASTLALSLTTACGDDTKGTASAGSTETTTGTTDGTASQSSSTVPTTSDATSDTGTASGSATQATTMDPTTGTTTTATTATSTTDDTDGCNDMPMQPINSTCSDASGCGCDTGKCFVVPALGGFCGECLVDADCAPGGCSVPNPIAGVGATCNEGGPGEGCMSDAVCVDPENGTCGTLLSVPGIITVATCGQCAAQADCMGHPNGPNCTPTYDVPNFKGKLDCVADGAIENNNGCSLEDDGMDGVFGDNACKSGFCGEASVMGLLKLGICGECKTDADCNGGMCTEPTVDLENGVLVGSVCM